MSVREEERLSIHEVEVAIVVREKRKQKDGRYRSVLIPMEEEEIQPFNHWIGQALDMLGKGHGTHRYEEKA